MNKKNNKMRNRLLAFSLAFALCMGAFAGFTMTTHAASSAYNTLKASVKRVNTVLGDRYEFDGYTDETIYPLLDQLSESEWTTLKNETTIDGVSPLDAYGTSKADYDDFRFHEAHPSDEDDVTNQNDSYNNSNADNNNTANNQSTSSYPEGSPRYVLGTPNWADADSKEAMFGRIRGESWHWTAKELEEDGWLAPVGTQFWEKGDMIHYRVTKAGTGSTFGEVQIIGYESWDTPSDSEWENATTSDIWAMNGPQRGIASNSTVFDVYAISNYIDDSRMDNSRVGGGMVRLGDPSNRYTSLENNKLAEFDFRMFAYCRYNHEWFIVTSIAPGAFKNRSDIRYAYIPDSVKEIPADCFKNCKNLKVVAWGSNALKAYEKDDIFRRSCPITSKTKKRIRKGAFSGCKKLKEFQLYGAYAEIKVDKNAFKKDKKQITVKTYEKGSYAKKFIKNISVKGKAKKEAKTKWGVPISDGWDTNSTNEPIKGKSKKSSKKK